MNLEIECKTPAEAEAAIRDGDIPLLMASMRLELSVSGRVKCLAGVVTLIAAGAAQIRAESWGTSTLNAVSRETSTLNAVSRETSTLNAVSRAYSRICLRGSVNAKATEHVSVLLMGAKPQVEGGGFVQRVILDTPEAWCEYYGVDVTDGHATLFKVVNSDYRSNHNGFQYLPGTTQKAPDWDPNPARECGGGLHFCPSPRHAQRFYPGAKNFIGLKVAVATLLVHPDGESPDKCRGPETLECFDVDINGKRLAPRELAAQ